MRDDRGRCGVTPVVWLLIAAQVGGLLLLWHWPAPRVVAVQARFGLQPAEVMAQVAALRDGCLAAIGRDPAGVLAELVMPFVTAPLVPCGPAQAILAVPFLLALGRRLEARGGWLAFAALAVLGGVAAGIAEVAVHGDGVIPRLGASGAVSAVVGAYGVLYRRGRVLMAVPVIVVPVFYQLPSFVVMVAWLLLQIRPIQRFLAFGVCEPWSWAGVAAGLAAGAVVGPMLVCWRPRRTAAAAS